MQFRFHQYNAEELKQCGRSFIDRFQENNNSGYTAWTKEVCSWFCECCAEGVPEVATYCRGCRGEFLVDLCHLVYPAKTVDTNSRRWITALDGGSFAMKLAMECEWGDARDHEQNVAAVLNDAAKLALLRSDVKVMVFASHLKDAQTHDEIVNRLVRLHSVLRDDSSWLYIDVPWGDRKPEHVRGHLIADNKPLSEI